MQPKFTGFSPSKLLIPVISSVPVIRAAEGLSQQNSMGPVAFNDLLGSSGRIYQDNKRNPHGGRESLIEELTTCAVWGGGITACKAMYDKSATKLTGGHVLFPKLDTALLKQHDEPSGALAKLLKRFSKPDSSLEAQVLDEKAVKAFNQNAPGVLSKAESQHLIDLVETGAKKSTYIWSRLAKLFICSTIPIIALALGIPTFNQWLTRKLVTKEKAQKAANQQKQAPAMPPLRAVIPSPRTKPQPAQTPAWVTPTAPGSASAFNIPPVQAPVFQAMSAKAQPALATAGTPRFGGLFSSVAQIVDPMATTLLNNTVLNTLLFNDIPLEAGRAFKAKKRSYDEFIEKVFQGGMIVGTLFILQPQIQKWTSRLFDKHKDIESGISYKALRILHDQPTKITASAELPQDDKVLVANIREHFAKPKAERPGSLLYELAEESGYIPLRADKRIDITQRIDLDGIKQLDGYLKKLESEMTHGKGAEQVKKLLRRNVGAKLSALLLTTGIGWLILSYFTPKMKQYITYKRTGKNQFPGLENL